MVDDAEMAMRWHERALVLGDERCCDAWLEACAKGDMGLAADPAAALERVRRYRDSGADLKAVVDRAIESKLDDAVASGVPEPLRTKDLLAAAKKQKPTTAEWFATAKNYVLYANDAGLYDDLKAFLRL